MADASIEAFDPAVSDPPILDEANPPTIDEVAFSPDGASMNAIACTAQGAGPHLTVVLLHGILCDEPNLDLAQAIRRAGWNVGFFHDRGAWGSRRQLSFVHVIEAVGALLAGSLDQMPEQAGDLRRDAGRLVWADQWTRGRRADR